MAEAAEPVRLRVDAEEADREREGPLLPAHRATQQAKERQLRDCANLFCPGLNPCPLATSKILRLCHWHCWILNLTDFCRRAHGGARSGGPRPGPDPLA